MSDKAEAVDHPSHYQTASGLEAIDVIEAFGLDFNLGNAVKYILRAGKKGARDEDLKKARWYLERALAGPKSVPVSATDPGRCGACRMDPNGDDEQCMSGARHSGDHEFCSDMKRSPKAEAK